jgi:N-acetylneuraminic acid mutarotase
MTYHRVAVTIFVALCLTGCSVAVPTSDSNFITPSAIATAMPATTTAESNPSAVAEQPTLVPALQPFTSGIWVQRATMPDPRSEMPAVTLNGLIYVPGGLGRTPTGSANGYGAVAGLDVYDPATNTWDTRAPLPEVRHHNLATVFEGRLYVFGGMDEPWRPTTTAWVYDPTIDAWTALAPLPQPRTSGAAVALGNYIYVIGGTGSPFQTPLPFLRYDPAANTWEERAQLRQLREHTAAVALDGKIYALGGRWNEDGLTSVEIYDPESDSWSWGPDMHYGRAGFAATVLDGKIYVAGGEMITALETLKSVEVYDPATNAWSDLPDMPAKLHGVPAVGLNGLLYIIGGSGRSADMINVGRLFVYQP